MTERSPEEIRAAIEGQRAELEHAVKGLRSEVESVTDWRSHMRKHRKQLVIAGAAAVFLLGLKRRRR